MARPPSITVADANTIVAILEQGQTEVDAYTAVGVAERTFFDWVAKGKKARKKAAAGKPLTETEALQSQFSQAIEKARAKGKTSLVDIIATYARNKEAPRNWHAAAWLLERMYPKEYGRKYIKIETGGDLDGAVPGETGDAIVTVTIQGNGKPPETAAPAVPVPPKSPIA